MLKYNIQQLKEILFFLYEKDLKIDLVINNSCIVFGSCYKIVMTSKNTFSVDQELQIRDLIKHELHIIDDKLKAIDIHFSVYKRTMCVIRLKDA